MKHPSRSRLILIWAGLLVLPACSEKELEGDADAGDGEEDGAEEIDLDVPEEADEEPAPCTSDGDCGNGLFCDGEETCGEDGVCVPGTPVDCADADPCTMDACDEETGRCTHDPLDEDGDGYVAEDCGGADCNDSARDVYPDADESACNLVDNDCDGDIRETIDDDDDGWVDEACDGTLTVEEVTAQGFDGMGDCDDGLDSVYPGAPEGCDGTVDHDCDGDETEIDADADHDGYAPPDCDPPEGMADCDDSEYSIHPGADEACDLVDQNCDGSILDAEGIDDDDDGVPDDACGGNDCNDESELVHGAFVPPEDVTDDPVAEEAELCDLLDQDCDGSVLDAPGADNDSDLVLDEDCGGTDCNDEDGSVYPDAPLSCDAVDHDCNGHGDEDNDNDSHVRDSCGGDDCDDSAPAIHPGAEVLCDPVDRDCNGYLDNDQDGDSHMRDACTGGDDCNDEDASIYPDAPEICDNVDQDCDGTAFDGPGVDDDGDLFIDAACPGGDDCNDDNARFRPGAEPDVCTEADYDCVGGVEPLGPDTAHAITEGMAGDEVKVALAWSGSEYGVVLTKFNGAPYNGYFLRLDRDGHLVPASGRWITSEGIQSTNPVRIAWGGGRWGIVYDGGSPTGARFVTLASDGSDPQPPGGTALDSAGCSPDLDPDIACNGTEFGVAWTCSNAPSGPYRVLFSRATTMGALTGSTINIADLADRNDVSSVRIAWNNAGLYGVVWTMASVSDPLYQVYLDLVDPGTPSHGADDRLSDVSAGGGAYSKSIAAGRVDPGSGSADGFAVVWYESPGLFSIKSAVFTVAGVKSPAPSTLRTGVAAQPSIAWNGTRFGVLLSAGGNVGFTQVSESGAAFGPMVPAASTAQQELYPALVWQEGRFGAAWIVSPPMEAWFAHLFCSGS